MTTVTGPPEAEGEQLATKDQVFTRGPLANAPTLVRSRDFGGTVRRIGRRLRPERWALVAVVVLTAAGVVLTLQGPKILGRATDVVVESLSPGQELDRARLLDTLLFALSLFGAGAACQWAQGHVLTGVVQRVMHRLRAEVQEKLERLPLRYIDGTSRGDLLSRVTNDLDNLSQSLQQSMSQVLHAGLSLVVAGAMMLVISPVLAVLTFVLVPVSVVLVRLAGRSSRRRFGEQWRHTGRLNGQVEEAFTGHALVRVFNRRDAVEAEFRATNDEVFEAAARAQFSVGVLQPATMFLGNLGYVATAVVGGLQVTAGTLTVGGIQAFFQYSRFFSQPLQQLAGMMNVLQSGVASAERVFQLLDAPEEDDDPAEPAQLPSPLRGRVQFEDVAFSYEPDRPLIEGLSFVAEPGQTVAIVGPTGAGKTTLVNLLLRFYEIDAGGITVDGVDTRALTRMQLRSRIGMVLQDTWLFEGTIRDNIAYGAATADEETILAAARAAYVDRFVHSLPDGYDTVIDDDGGNLSAGEKQLLTIARAFLADPAILVLDEATSSVDTRTEMLVQHATAALRSRRTSFVIAHRLSTIRDADLILVMDGGRIVEQGTHEELLARPGAYFALYDSQFRQAAADADA